MVISKTSGLLVSFANRPVSKIEHSTESLYGINQRPTTVYLVNGEPM